MPRPQPQHLRLGRYPPAHLVYMLVKANCCDNALLSHTCSSRPTPAAGHAQGETPGLCKVLIEVSAEVPTTSIRAKNSNRQTEVSHAYRGLK